jgi:glycosyltransferase involved in cell wall biosynthesis
MNCSNVWLGRYFGRYLKPNLHASGITVLGEAAIWGVPIVATDTGGLRAYFPAEEVFYIPGGDPLVLRKAILKLAADDALRFALAKRAQERMKSGFLSSRAYAKRHAELSRALLAAEAPAYALDVIARAAKQSSR